MVPLPHKYVLTIALTASIHVSSSLAGACDINSIDPACGYISQNPANINSLNNPSNPNSPFNINNPNNPASLNNPNNPSNPNNPNSPLNSRNQPYGAENIGNPYSPYNLQHPESPYSALNPKNSNYQGTQAARKALEERREHGVHYKEGFRGFFSYVGGGTPVVIFWRSGVEYSCRLRVDCPRSVYAEGSFPVPDRVASEPESAPTTTPHIIAPRRRGSAG